ncbi:MAG: type III pantothenate kinase [Planctomycetaceae bacterium]|nr:type III pantothenate kinase [Planctomycetaceae bacterium]
MFAVDVGNTRLKTAFFPPSGFCVNELVVRDVFTRCDHWGSEKHIKFWLRHIEEPQDWFIAKTGQFPWEKWQECIAELRPKDRFIHLSYKDIPIVIDVKNPEEVGLDRLLAVYAASLWRKEHEERFAEGTPVLVADAGTALTVDVLTVEGHFGGGIIFPGLNALAEALAGISPRLPKIDCQSLSDLYYLLFPARDTYDACAAGLILGAMGVIRQCYEFSGGNIPILITGGDGNTIYSGITYVDIPEELVHLEEHLVLSGIAAVAEKKYSEKEFGNL